MVTGFVSLCPDNLVMAMEDLFGLPEGEAFVVKERVAGALPVEPLRKLDNFSILFVEEGRARVELDFCTYELEPGVQLIVGPALFFRCVEADDDLTVSCITLSSDLWQEATAPFSHSFFAFLRKYPLTPVLPDEVVEKNRHMLKAVEVVYRDWRNAFRRPMFRNFIQNFLMEVYDKTKIRFLNRDDPSSTRKEELLAQFLDLVFEHAGTQRKVKFYADRMCITTNYLASLVQGLVGQSPKALIDARCIQEIKLLLRTTTVSVQEIAFRLEFPDQSFFARYFRKHTGLSPLEYRERQAGSAGD